MAKTAKWTLPTVVNPPDTICFTIRVPNERYHIAAFRGALLDLASAYKWQDDSAHTAKDVANVWRNIVEDVTACIDPAALIGGEIGDEGMRLQVNPDNPCQIMAWNDCTNDWCVWFDASSCVSGIVGVEAGQPGPFGTISPGDCKTFNAIMRGNEKWLLPTSVKAGDQIIISGATGGILMDGAFDWRCPSGDEYILGACVPYTVPCGACPMPSLVDGRLIAQVGTAWYDAYNNTIVVPGTVTSPVMVAFQVNDADLTDNSGSYSFQVEVCASYPVISISYDSGSGPTSATHGSTLIMSSSPTPGTSYHELGFTLPSGCVNFTMTAISGWTAASGEPDGLAPGCGAWGSAGNWFRGLTLPISFTGKDRVDLNSDSPFTATFEF